MQTSIWLGQALPIGIGATLLMDGWLWLLQRCGVKTQNFAMIGRWAGHLAQGRVRHAAIGAAPPVSGELALGWAVHYAVGIGFALLLLLWQGPAWLAAPRPLPALCFGWLSVAAPLLLMQPAMGLGLFTLTPAAALRQALRSLLNHTVFGLGLYLSALALS
ncbi:DUF2938 family protein [Massilia sp. TS11]|uniref:DUF2938 family protein n=1 Tax=Massilia sp. TS11 TaxID=2908003 RepID=UPI001ED9F9CB|nr:DUF2938 family protein [Massilia sp. TS11]MCG2583832.1 DUF2938 domain-containing protein [Massilia sp. TS11]